MRNFSGANNSSYERNAFRRLRDEQKEKSAQSKSDLLRAEMIKYITKGPKRTEDGEWLD